MKTKEELIKQIDNLKDDYNNIKKENLSWLENYTKQHGRKTQKFVIPISKLSREEAEKQILDLMSSYHEDVEWNEQTGEVNLDHWTPKNGTDAYYGRSGTNGTSGTSGTSATSGTSGSSGINLSDYVVGGDSKKPITYTEYLAEKIDKSIDYSDYIAENLDKSIDYSDYIAENLDIIKYNDYKKPKPKSKSPNQEFNEWYDGHFTHGTWNNGILQTGSVTTQKLFTYDVVADPGFTDVKLNPVNESGAQIISGITESPFETPVKKRSLFNRILKWKDEL